MKYSITCGIFFTLLAVSSAFLPDGRCPRSRPLQGHYCGRGGTPCPPGYQCNIAPDDRYAVCCRTSRVRLCPRGNPLPGIFCGVGGVRCPGNFYCEIAPNDSYAVCCPLAGGGY